MSKLRVYLVDDHSILREGLALLVNSQPDMEVVGQAGDGEEALEGISALAPEVVVLDVSMPKLGGAETTERLKLSFPHIRVLVLTRHGEQSYLRQLLRAGASGYVLKKAAAEELIGAIRAVAAGGTYLDSSLAGHVVDNYVGQQAAKTSSRGGNLSEREAEVLRLIALGHSNKEIASQLNISVRTAETYKVRLMEKLGLNSRAEIVRYALQQGWLQDS
ncbi:MAG: response regulator transcription factor [Pyrinomonadaceae bacterium]